ncbi:hypothetical protein LEL86_17295 [Streptomyces sp. WA6-1-16]|uniref:hypothetical protein n=1 Tax=Streptomyces sp. WA6-1-16 TaxID=2879427 RepID=UPI001CE3435A|nr:hypothetical protein [Streptomyces sp. WA6-1-16]UCA50931.1 hypothetical protein LEL86_17295 [Streptomyces sp. WA6-1-16]
MRVQLLDGPHERAALRGRFEVEGVEEGVRLPGRCGAGPSPPGLHRPARTALGRTARRRPLSR